MCAFCGASCVHGDATVSTLPVSSVLADWLLVMGDAVAAAVRPVGVVGPTVHVEATSWLEELPGGRAAAEAAILRAFDSPQWRERVTRVRWVGGSLAGVA